MTPRYTHAVYPILELDEILAQIRYGTTYHNEHMTISGNNGMVWNKTKVTSNLAYAINMIVFMKAVQRDTSQFITKG